MAIDEAIVDLIDAAVGALTKDTNLFAGPVRPSPPAFSCFVMDSGTEPPQLYASGGGTDLKFISVKAITRGDEKKFEAGQTMSNAVLAAVHKTSPAGALPNTCIAEQSRPFYLGEDEQGLPMWSTNFTVNLRE